MKIDIFNIKGKSTKKINLPKTFSTEHRPDIIKRAFLAFQSQNRQSYGADPKAGLRTSAHYHGRRRERWTMMNREKARMPRLHATTPHLNYRAREISGVVKGRKAFSPRSEKKWNQKINKKENILAVKSAIAATADKKLVEKRGHKVDELKNLPIIIEDSLESIKKTKDIEKLLKNLGLEKELKRVQNKKIRGSKAAKRARKYKRKTGFLFIVTKDDGIADAVKNIPGTDISYLKDLDANLLAPGAHAGRLTIWSKSAIQNLDKVFGE